MTSTDLAIRDPSAAIPAKIQYSRALAEAGLLPASYRKQPANILYAMEYADMLGLPAMAAITGIHLIDGRPAISSGLISALVRRAGHRLRVIGDEHQAQAELTRADDPGFTYKAVWTVKRAEQAGLLGKQNWRQYPAAMLKARAISEVARDACQEVLLGVSYTPEELGSQGLTDDEAAGMGLMTTAERVEHNDLRRMGEPPPGAVEKLPATPDDDPWYDTDPAAQDAAPPSSEAAPPDASPAPPAPFARYMAKLEQLGVDGDDADVITEWLAPDWQNHPAVLRKAASTLDDFLKSAGGDKEQARSDLWSRFRIRNKMAGIEA